MNKLNKKFAVLGHPISHSLSPQIHSLFAKEFSIDLEYKKFDVNQDDFDEKAKEDFLHGAKIAYETIITNFASGNLKNIKYLLDKKVFDEFNDALAERKKNGHKSQTTFIGISSALVKEHKKIDNIIEVTVDFVSEIISCIKDKDNKILSGDPEKAKNVFDTWKFSKDSKSNNPNWLLTDTQI